jgi:hypothetical protein
MGRLELKGHSNLSMSKFLSTNLTELQKTSKQFNFRGV